MENLPSKNAVSASVAQSVSKNESTNEYINAPVGSVDTLNERFLIECLLLENSTNVKSSIIVHTVHFG